MFVAAGVPALAVTFHADARVPSGIGESQLLDWQFAFDHVDGNGVTVEGDGAVAGCGGEEANERMHLQFRSKIQGLVNGRVTEAGERANQREARHGACVPVAALIFVPGIAGAPIVTATQGLDDGEAFLGESFMDQVRCDLVFDPCPHFVGVDEGKRGFVAARPTA